MLAAGWQQHRQQRRGTTCAYAVDVREDGDHFYVEAELPGFKKDDVTSRWKTSN